MGSLGRDTLLAYLDELLEPERYSDQAPNGLQVAGASTIRRIVTGVSANLALLDAAIAVNADAVLVHHGVFWTSEPPTLTLHRAHRMRRLLDSNLSLFAYHLPLDAHITLGNNAQLLAELGATADFGFAGTPPIGRIGHLPTEAMADELREAIERLCDRPAVAFLHGPRRCSSVAALSGAGARHFEEATAIGADLFVTGEPSEPSQALARELDANFLAVGHHATERFGPKALGEHLAQTFSLDVQFIDIPNPV